MRPEASRLARRNADQGSATFHPIFGYVFDEGRIIEQGDHNALMELKGHYHKLVTIQTQLTKLEG